MPLGELGHQQRGHLLARQRGALGTSRLSHLGRKGLDTFDPCRSAARRSVQRSCPLGRALEPVSRISGPAPVTSGTRSRSWFPQPVEQAGAVADQVGAAGYQHSQSDGRLIVDP
jgi:hypothetical protein